MSLTANNWYLNSYTTSTWTTLIAASGPTVLKSMVVSIGSTGTNVQVRVADSTPTLLFTILPSVLLLNTASYFINLPAMTLVSGQYLQVWADQNGATFSAHGAD